MIMDYILSGKEFKMGHNLSTLSVVRMDRDPRNPAIDWGESNKYKAELIANGDKHLKYYWRKGKCTVKNKSVYRFDATRGVKGNKGKLKELDELEYLKFRKN